MTKLITHLLLLSLLVIAPISYAKSEDQVSHVIVVWLKKPGDAQMREQFIKASRALDQQPGIISRHVSAVMPSDNPKIDDTFDVAVTVTFKDATALENYMQSPLHKKMLHEQLQPLVNRIVVYNFGQQ